MKLSAEEESQSHSDAVISVQSAHDSAVSSHSDHKVLWTSAQSEFTEFWTQHKLNQFKVMTEAEKAVEKAAEQNDDENDDFIKLL